MQTSNLNAVAQQWLTNLQQCLAARDITKTLELFVDDCFWRDLLAFTWNIRTLEGREAIAGMLDATLIAAAPDNWVLDGEASESGGVLEAWFRFETSQGRGRGIVRLKEGKCWTLMTSLQELKNFEEPAGPRRIKGVEHTVKRGRTTWLENRIREQETLGISTQPYCLIIGGGQGGIGLAARLKRLGVSGSGH